MTKVTPRRIEDFQLFTNAIGEYTLSSSPIVPNPGYLYPNGQSVSKTDWFQLYSTGNFDDDPDDDTKFVLPVVASTIPNTYIYLIGKILSSNTVQFNDGRASAMTFSNADLDSNFNLTFLHGIIHLNPIIQVYTELSEPVLPSKVTNSVGQSIVNIGREINGVWKVIAYG